MKSVPLVCRVLSRVCKKVRRGQQNRTTNGKAMKKQKVRRTNKKQKITETKDGNEWTRIFLISTVTAVCDLMYD